MTKSIGKFFLLGGLVLCMGAGCSATARPADVQKVAVETQPLFPEPKKVQEVVQEKQALPEAQVAVKSTSPIDCLSDKNCAVDILTRCAPGSFLVGEKEFPPIGQYSIREKKSDGCHIDVEYKDLPVDGPDAAYYKSLKGLSMSCLVPPTVTDLEALDKYITGKFDFKPCSGPLKDTMFAYAQKQFAEFNTRQEQVKTNVCSDSACIEGLLKDCAPGNFVLTRTDDQAKKEAKVRFSIVTKASHGCLADVDFITNSRPALVGPTMRCSLKDTMKTAGDIQNFISHKFNSNGPLDSGDVCGGELYTKFLDLIKEPFYSA